MVFAHTSWKRVNDTYLPPLLFYNLVKNIITCLSGLLGVLLSGKAVL